MSKKKEPTNLKWLVDIFDPLDEVYKNRKQHPIEIIMSVMQMVYNSIDMLKKKFKIKEYKLEDLHNISSMYIELLSKANANLLMEYAESVERARYTIPERELDYLKEFFVKVLRNDFEQQILIELFVNNFMQAHFPAMLVAAKQYKEMEKIRNMVSSQKKVASKKSSNKK